MNLCSDGHDEICFEDRRCPFCAYIGDMDTIKVNLEREISDLNEVIADLKAEISARD